MTPPLPHSRTSWFFKFCECVLTVIAVFSVLMMPLEALPQSFWMKYGQYFQYVLVGLIGGAVLGSVAYTQLWHRREQKSEVNSGLRHAWLQGIIRYWLALEISTYGFAKILKTQFDSPSFLLDMPVGDLNGFQLTWHYYGYSYALAVIIALFQIGGSVLLLYRRTTLLGVMILLPVMVNVVLINVFFSISPAALFNSVVFTLALLFFLLLDVAKLKRAFWDVVERLPSVTLGRNWVKHGLRVLPIAVAFAIIKSLVATHPTDKLLVGTWKVEKLTRNGRGVPTNAWLTDTAAWKRVYFAGWQGCAFSPNPYRFRFAESVHGNYEFDSLKNDLRISFYRQREKRMDTLWATVSQRTAKEMQLQGVWGRDTVDMQLARLR